MTTPTYNDGRRMLVECESCGGDDLSVELDPVDDTLWVACAECRDDIVAADVVEADVTLTTVVNDLNQLDPAIRGNVEVRDE